MSTTRQKAGPPPDVGAVLFGLTRRRVLGWLFGHADEAFYLRQIVRLTGAAHGAVQRELDLLVSAGLLERTVQGRQVYFRANRSSPVFPELQSLLVKTAGVVDVLRESLAPLAEELNAALVFGSAARGTLRQGSDIDLLVIGSATFMAVAEAVRGAQEKIGRDVNPTVYPPEEFRAKILRGHRFLTGVLAAPHLFVIGGPDELDGLGAKRLAHGPSPDRERDEGPARRRGARSS